MTNTPYYHPDPEPQEPGWGQPVPPPPPPKKSRVGLFIAAGVVIVLRLVGALVLGAQTDKGTLSGQRAVAPVAEETAKPAAKPTKPKISTRVGEGTFRVGKDVAPGEYRTAGAAESDGLVLCYWHTARDTGTSRIIDQGVSDKTDEAGLVRLRKGQYFKTSGCKDWVKQ